MTIDDLKKLDKQIRQIADPFGAGLPSLCKVFGDWSKENGAAVSDLVREYSAWKLKK